MDTEMNTPGMEEVDYLAALLLKQLRQEITETELQYLENWKAAHPSHALVSEQVNNGEQLFTDLVAMKQVDMEGWWQKISEQVNIVKKPVPLVRRWYTYAAAAAVLLIAGAIAWPYLVPKKLPVPLVEKYTPAKIDVLPGGNNAILILSNGITRELGHAAIGKLAQEGDVTVVKVKDGELKYEYEKGNKPNEATIGEVWNTLSTPRGGQYSLVLSDGSKVWLNAASYIKYPTHFSAKERRVAIAGEVYFDVANAAGKGGEKKPFIVDVLTVPGRQSTQVEVLGTQFNIMAYVDENPGKITLVNGKVKISVSASTIDNRKNSKLLAPGQQAQIPQVSNVAGGDIKVVELEDMEDVLAWKNGFIPLQNSDIKYIMRMLSRWYDIDVTYEGKIPDYKFNGYIPRSENISAVIKTLEYAGVHFKLQNNNKITVLP